MATTPEEFMKRHLDEWKKEAQRATPERRRQMIDAIVLAVSDVLTDKDIVRDAFDNGKAEGLATGLATGLINVLEIRGFSLSAEVQALIRDCLDPEVLGRWHQRAKKAASLDEIFG